MDIARAIEILDPKHREHYESIEPVMEACRMGQEALEKQLPKKVTHEASKRELRTCPSCLNVAEKFITLHGEKTSVKFIYCPLCGQKLDWSEEEE